MKQMKIDRIKELGELIYLERDGLKARKYVEELKKIREDEGKEPWIDCPILSKLLKNHC